MQTHNLVPRTKNKKTELVGRGGKRGKTSGRGAKGQNSRAGRKKRPEIRDFIKRLPKLRGRGVNQNKVFAVKAVAVNLKELEAFKAGSVVSPATLVEKNIIKLFKGKIPKVKILATGDITQKLSFEKVEVSAEAKAKIEKAGGSVAA